MGRHLTKRPAKDSITVDTAPSAVIQSLLFFSTVIVALAALHVLQLHTGTSGFDLGLLSSTKRKSPHQTRLRSLASPPSSFGGFATGGGYLLLSEVKGGKEVICSHGDVRCEVLDLTGSDRARILPGEKGDLMCNFGLARRMMCTIICIPLALVTDSDS